MSSAEASEFASRLRQQGISAVAFDFDATALNFNTNPSTSYNGSFYYFTLQYTNKMSPDFVALVPKLIDMNIKVGIATFNDDIINDIRCNNDFIIGGNALVRPVLRHLFPDIHDSIEIWAWNPDKHSSYAPDGCRIPSNKNWHLEAMARRYGIRNPSQVLLVDDLESNIVGANLKGFRTIKVNGTEGFKMNESTVM